MKATAKAKLAAQGRRIMSEAKKIRKANPGMKWTNCVKKAAKKGK